jgi:GcrA cell cycle regulator
MTDPFTWTAEKEQRLRDLWAEKQRGTKISASTIAAELGTTRSACLGKLNRLGLLKASGPREKRQLAPRAPRAPMLKVNGSEAPVRKPEPLPDPPPIVLAPRREEPPPAPGEGVTLVELRLESCRWPMGNPLEESFRFCGQHRIGTGPYCEAHHKVAFTPNVKRARLAPRS